MVRLAIRVEPPPPPYGQLFVTFLGLIINICVCVLKRILPKKKVIFI